MHEGGYINYAVSHSATKLTCAVDVRKWDKVARLLKAGTIWKTDVELSGMCEAAGHPNTRSGGG